MNDFHTDVVSKEKTYWSGKIYELKKTYDETSIGGTVFSSASGRVGSKPSRRLIQAWAENNEYKYR